MLVCRPCTSVLKHCKPGAVHGIVRAKISISSRTESVLIGPKPFLSLLTSAISRDGDIHASPSNRRSRLIRCLSSSAQRTEDVPSSRHQALTILHKVKSFLPRALLPLGLADKPSHSLGLWQKILARVSGELEAGPSDSAKANVVVYDVDDWAGGKHLLAALLENPFVSDKGQRNKIQQILDFNSREGGLTIESSSSSTSDNAGSLLLSSAWLTEFRVPISITACSQRPSQSTTQNGSNLSELSDMLFNADIPIIICNPLTIPIHTLIHLSIPFHNPNTIIIFVSPNEDDGLVSYVEGTLIRSVPPQFMPADVSKSPKRRKPHPRILLMDPRRAEKAVQSLQSDSKSSSAILKYQENFIGSNVASLTQELKAILPPSLEDPQNALILLKTRTALAHIRGALEACAATLENAKEEMNELALLIADLRSEVELAKVKTQKQVLDGDAQVKKALGTAENDMKALMDRLTWWRMLARVDDISQIIRTAMEETWCKELQRELLVHTGRLTSVQEELTAAIMKFVSVIPPSSAFYSPVLQNRLEQMTTSPSYALESSVLLSPIHARRDQIVTYPTTRLHVAAQRATIVTSGSILTGAGTISLIQLYGLISPGVEMGTAVGLGVFGTLMGIRWAVGRWEKAKKRWWEDWHRVGEGLGRDLQAQLDQVMTQRVGGVVHEAAVGFEGLMKKRKAEYDNLKDEHQILQAGLIKLEESVEET